MILFFWLISKQTLSTLYYGTSIFVFDAKVREFRKKKTSQKMLQAMDFRFRHFSSFVNEQFLWLSLDLGIFLDILVHTHWRKNNPKPWQLAMTSIVGFWFRAGRKRHAYQKKK